jgi:cytoskeletal protein RodZ
MDRKLRNFILGSIGVVLLIVGTLLLEGYIMKYREKKAIEEEAKKYIFSENEKTEELFEEAPPEENLETETTSETKINEGTEATTTNENFETTTQENISTSSGIITIVPTSTKNKK